MELIKINDSIRFAVLSKEATSRHADSNFTLAQSQFRFSSYFVIRDFPELRANGKYKDIKSSVENEYGFVDFEKDNLIIFYK